MGKLIDNTATIKAKLQQALKTGLVAVGQEAVGMVREQMTSGYDHPVYDTGTLARSINAQVDVSGESVSIGTNIEYAGYVHDGHAGHAVFFPDIGEYRVVKGGYTPGRPFLRDALENGENVERLKEVLEDVIKQQMV